MEARRGVDMDRERFELAISHIKEDLARGLSPQQIAEARAELVGVSKSTIYRWVEEGYGGTGNAELRRKVGCVLSSVFEPLPSSIFEPLSVTGPSDPDYVSGTSGVG